MTTSGLSAPGPARPWTPLWRTKGNRRGADPQDTPGQVGVRWRWTSMNGTTRGRSGTAPNCRAQLPRFRSPRWLVREDLLEKAVWSQHLKVGGCGSFTHCQQTFSGVPYAQLLPGAKSNMEGVLGQPSLAGAWVRAWVTSSNFLSVGVVSSFVNVAAAGAGRMTMTRGWT